MSIEEHRQASELDEFLTRAVDRQIAEQRALGDALADLTDAVRELVSRPAPSPTKAPDVSEMQETIAAVSTDVEGIAQALIDLNTGLRDWAAGVDRNIKGSIHAVNQLRETVERYRELAERTPPPPPPPPPAPVLSPELPPMISPDTGPIDEPEVVEAHLLDETIIAPPSPRSELETRVRESIELAVHLGDQMEDMDQVIGRMADLPMKLEGVVAQALRRAMSARAKLDRDAETALDDAVASLDEHVEKITTSIDRFNENEESLRKLTLGQVELSSRLESLYTGLLDRLEGVETDRQRSDAALAAAIDRSAKGKDPKALASLKKTVRKRSAPRKKTTRNPTVRKASDPLKPARRRKPTD